MTSSSTASSSTASADRLYLITAGTYSRGEVRNGHPTHVTYLPGCVVRLSPAAAANLGPERVTPAHSEDEATEQPTVKGISAPVARSTAPASAAPADTDADSAALEARAAAPVTGKVSLAAILDLQTAQLRTRIKTLDADTLTALYDLEADSHNRKPVLTAIERALEAATAAAEGAEG